MGCGGWSGVGWRKLEGWSGVAWSAGELDGVQWGGRECGAVEWNGVKWWCGVEWSEVEGCEDGRRAMDKDGE